ncbi:MAG: helix-turn-helix domain-containing protein [Chloroflexi bacterium]|nr:helix-turn-helix domain-containing protein [Chloroflexota bacterium]
MRPKGSAAALEARRQRAGTLLEKGLGIRKVARQVGSSPSSVKREAV